MKYRIIGDIHGRVNWQKLVNIDDLNTINIFLGDFTDPYYGYEKVASYQQMIEQINKVFELKKQAPDRVIILASNHDNQYWINDGDSNRFDRLHCKEINKLFVDNTNLFHGVAYSIGEKYLITHAGVTWDWYQKQFNNTYNKDITTLKEICDNINTFYNESIENKIKFTFGACTTKLSDYYGVCPSHSPLWVRPRTLWDSNLFGFDSGIIQVIGHTRFEPMKHSDKDLYGTIATYGTLKTPIKNDEDAEDAYRYVGFALDGMDKCSLIENDSNHVDIILCDCLFNETACIEIDDTDLTWKKILIQ